MCVHACVHSYVMSDANAVIYADLCSPTELMVTMGFPKDEITESLQNQKYDDVMATYLLLGRKAPEVGTNT